MKVNNISYNLNCNNNRRTTEKQNAPSFKGMVAVNFWDAIARGGFAASFTVQDMLGTNFPRTYQALQRNKEITGENNYKAAAEVAIREFMTGPSMCIIPMLVLAASKKISGTANEVPVNNIAAFSDELKIILENNTSLYSGAQIQKNYPAEWAKQVRSDFYERMFALALGEDLSDNKAVSDNAKEFAKMLEQYDNAPKRGFIKQLFNIDLINKSGNAAIKEGEKIEAKDQILGRMVTKFSDIKKHLTDNYSTLLVTDMNGKLEKPNDIDTLIKDISNFGNDFENELKKYTPKDGGGCVANLKFNSFSENFKVKRAGSKFITNLLMVLSTIAFLFQIPKLYTLYKTNPETDVFRQNKSEVKNANK